MLFCLHTSVGRQPLKQGTTATTYTTRNCTYDIKESDMRDILNYLTNSVANLGMVAQTEKSVTGFYTPSADLECNELALRRIIEKKYNVKLATYDDFHKWSCEKYDLFWKEMAEFANINLSEKQSEVIDVTKSIDQFPKWFTGAKLNYTENLIANYKDSEKAAVIEFDCDLSSKTLSFKRLYEDVTILGSALRKRGVQKGDAVCGFLPNSYETLVALLSTAAIGAVWSSASLDFGPNGVLDRFKQVKPKILFVANATTYKRKAFEMRDKVNEIVKSLPSLESVVMIQHKDIPTDFKQFECGEKFEFYTQLMAEKAPTSFVFEQVPFDHPLFIMFSSGTTGVPKAIVHTAGGTLLKHMEEHIIQSDAKSTDVMFFYTTCGWMMYNWAVSFLVVGGTLVLYDESPLEPDPHVLPKIAGKSQATIIGMGAMVYDRMEKLSGGCDFYKEYRLENLRLVLSTGSPLKESSFEFINTKLSPQCVIGSISGGTDIIGCFMGASLSKDVVSGQCQCLYLGMDIKALNHEGKSVEDDQGELACLTPFPSMPSHFLGDVNHAKYKKAYFEGFEGVWSHGDYCIIDSKTKGVVMLGRSDATLNRGGVRMGTAEIYNVVETIPEVADCLVVGRAVHKEKDEEIILFVKMSEGHVLDDILKKKISTLIRQMQSPRHVPNVIHDIEDIPYTNSGKKVELAVKQLINGFPVQKASSLRNPDSLDLFLPFKMAA